LRKLKNFHSNLNFHLNSFISAPKNSEFFFLFTSSIWPSAQSSPPVFLFIS
jgi:hypothetical protein